MRGAGRAWIVALACLAAGPSFPHGASKGLHLHVEPDPASPGAGIRVRVDASEPVVELRISFVDAEPERVLPDRPVKSLVVPMTVPSGAKGGTINLQAEAVGRAGKVLRASAVVRVEGAGPQDPSKGNGSGARGPNDGHRASQGQPNDA